MAMSALGFADKIVLTGKPVALIPNADYYTFPATYTPMHSYHYVSIASDNRVCFINKQPELSSLDLLRIWIVAKDKKFFWFCYRYSPQYFTINF
jgi:hypothetical protein